MIEIMFSIMVAVGAAIAADDQDMEREVYE